MIQAYPHAASVFAGGRLRLHVSTDQPRFRVEFYRQGRELARVDGIPSDPLPGRNYPPGPTDQDWGWPSYDFEVPAHWASGVYIAMFVAIDAGGREFAPDRTTADGTEGKALFVVRNAAPGRDSKVLYKLSWATFHAYNGTGYGSLYAESVWSEQNHAAPGFKVTTRRPGGGTGGVVMMGDPPDYYAPGSRRQTFEHWDVPFIRWLEARGYLVDYCTDLDVHQDRGLLRPYNLLLSVGHDEYWSPEMRAAIDAFVARGGNMAYFSGNIAFFRIHFTDDDTAITCAKAGPSAVESTRWEQDVWGARDPENRTTGVEFAGGWFDGRRDPVGYTVQHAGHWVYQGTGLSDGDIFGADDDLPLVGYECDGAHFVRKHGWAQATGRHGTPSTFFILGLAELSSDWQMTLVDRPAATMGTYTSPRGGIVFQAATTDWPMAVGRNSVVAQITMNVLNRLRLPSARLVGPLPPRFGRAVAAVGEISSFHVDTDGLAGSNLHYDWEAAGATVLGSGKPRVDVQMPAQTRPVTVSVTIRDDSGPVAFGTQTLVPISRDALLRLEISHLLHEMITPGDPETARTALLNPQVLGEHLTTVNLALIEDRAARLQQAAVELLRICTSDGHRQVIPDPRRPWAGAGPRVRPT
jgi:hypothetical protein